MAKILIVEDDDTFREILKVTVGKEGHDVEGASDGKSAQYILSVKSFDAVLSDVRMPQMSGVDLLKWIKEHYSIPVILMTGFSEILETTKAAELGADGFLPKPFTLDDLNDSLNKCLKQKPQGSTEESQDEGFYKISIEDFISGREIPYTIYLKLPQNRFVKIAYRGEDVSLDRIRTYKSKGVNFLYLSKEDFARYIGLTLRISNALKGNSAISSDKKKTFLRHAGEVLLEKVYVDGVDRALFENSRSYVQTTLSILSEGDDLRGLLEALNQHADYLYAHALGVSIYGVMLAQQMKWNSTPTIFKVSMSGLYHDIGKKEIDRLILDKKRVQMHQSERAEFETHPQRGMEILGGVGGVPEEVVQVALQHHETNAGLGYPKGISKAKISPLSKLVSVANVFCEYAIANPQSHGMSAHDAIAQMQQFRLDSLDPEFFGALKILFKFNNKS